MSCALFPNNIHTQGVSQPVVVALLPLAFGAAHLHHLLELTRKQGIPLAHALRIVVFQCLYTTIFGAYACVLLLRSGNLLAPVAAHCFCNAMGFPPLAALAQSRVLAAATAVGVVAFAGLLGPATAAMQPAGFSSALASAQAYMT